MRKISATLSTLFIGHFTNFLMDETFDFILYPAVLAYFGLIKGAVIMWTLSFLVCFGMVIFYNWSKKDWLGIELVKKTLSTNHSSIFMRLLVSANHRGRWVVLLLLSITTDPFICVVYMREGSHTYHKMNRRDWRIFLSSFVISNAWWTFVMFTGITFIKYIINYLGVVI